VCNKSSNISLYRMQVKQIKLANFERTNFLGKQSEYVRTALKRNGEYNVNMRTGFTWPRIWCRGIALCTRQRTFDTVHEPSREVKDCSTVP
jgi:hypothetical protein